MTAFHAYDIRGIYGKDFTKEDAYKIGYFLPSLFQTDKILVGRDVRESSPEIFRYLSQGITDNGADVFDIGHATTPMVYFATAKYDFEASVMITASHNPKEYNGMKVSRANALPVGYDTGLQELEKMIKEDEIIVNDMVGKLIKLDVKQDYINFLQKYKTDLSDLKIAADLSNGMAGLLARDVFGDDIYYLYEEPDGTFPNHEANPLNPENIVDLQNAVKEKNADMGIIFDGDGDRVMFVDENADFISPDLMIALLADYFQKEEGGKCLQDIRTSKSVGEYIGERFDLHTWRVGRAYAAAKLREIDGVFGGELAGHYYFRDFFYSDSGILAALILSDIIARNKKKGISLSQLIAKIKNYHNSGEINFRIEQKEEAMQAVKKHLTEKEKPTKLLDFDGYRIEYPDWWISIRPSNTEPYLRLLIEAKTEKLLQEKITGIKSLIETFN